MDEATAAAVNSAVQSAIGAISGGVATAQGGVASLEAHAGQVSGLNEQAAAVQEAAGAVSCQSEQAAAVGDAAAQLQSGLSQIESGLATLNADDTQKQDDAQTAAGLTAIKQYVDGIDAGLTTLVEGEDAQKLAAGAQTLQAMGTVGSKEQPSLEAAAGAVATKVGALAKELPDILGENNKNVTDLQTGVKKLADGAKALQTGYKSTLLKGIDQLLSGAKQLTKIGRAHV